MVSMDTIEGERTEALYCLAGIKSLALHLALLVWSQGFSVVFCSSSPVIT